ncbi:MAG: cupin domain-containing protein [Nitrospira sp. BO4]|nr:cupin domain-containing protein [Nitrospira sp. BO4]
MTEARLPEELEEQAMLDALGILDPVDRLAFTERLPGESPLLSQAVAAYRAATDALVSVVPPVTPPVTLRERLVNQIATEAAQEVEQFELTADTLALGSVPLKPRDSLRERLMSRIEGQSDVRLDVRISTPGLVETSVSTGGGRVGEGRAGVSKDIEGSPSRQFAHAWHHLLVTSYTSLRLCWKAFSNLLRTMLIRSGPSRLSRTKIGFQQSGKGLTFIKAAEGVWREIAPGVTAKVLSFDMVSRKTTALLRFAPGTSYAPHRHTEAEELYVLEGGCSIAGREMTVGDYQHAEAGTEHYDTSTDEGCLLLVVSSPQNEILH